MNFLANKRIIKTHTKLVKHAENSESKYKNLSDQELRLRASNLQGHALDNLAETFALVRETSNRILKKRHYDVQLIGGAVLASGMIAEMATGEGKTLAATLATTAHALDGIPVHSVTANDYLAKRDMSLMAPLFNALGLTCGVIYDDQDINERRDAYTKNITFGTSSQFGFDYLRDNMVMNKNDRVQSKLGFCLIDEVDSILIDEARTPLIISGPIDESIENFVIANELVPLFTIERSADDDDLLDSNCDGHTIEKTKQVHLTENGYLKLENALKERSLIDGNSSVYKSEGLHWVHLICNALIATHSYILDVDYLIDDNEIQIIDPNTGRALNGQRWGEGVHQSIEAKEGIEIKPQTMTLGTITLQNYFKLYDKIAGMTGTALTEEEEFGEIYGLRVVTIKPHRIIARLDEQDKLIISHKGKIKAILNDVKESHERGQPVLIGTTSVDASEELSLALSKENINHETLNAKNHGREADIIAQAGRLNAVTIATNMAGRGTDIILGGNLDFLTSGLDSEKKSECEVLWLEEHNKVLSLGGLRVVGTERYDSRRIDNQLRGRAGRQGDPGSSVFYLSLEDRLMRLFGSDKLEKIFSKFGVQEDEPFSHSLVDKAILDAQKKIEGHGYDGRKNLVKFDSVANEQRNAIYRIRDEWLLDDDSVDLAQRVINTSLENMLDAYLVDELSLEEWNVKGLEEEFQQSWGVKPNFSTWLNKLEIFEPKKVKQKIQEQMISFFNSQMPVLSQVNTNKLIRDIAISTLDHLWQSHQESLTSLKLGIHLRSYAQKQPLQEYQKESFHLFQELLTSVQNEFVTRFLLECRKIKALQDQYKEQLKAKSEEEALEAS